MGKGDKRTKRGKLFRGSTGKTNPRMRTSKKGKAEAKAPAARTPRAPREQPAPPPAASEE
jgi:30S ribosomal protein S31